MLTDLVPAACEWRHTHACRFDVLKFNLLHFTRITSHYFPIPLVFDSTTIHPTDTAKYLGLILDHKLRWKPQVAAAVAKGTKALLGISHLAQPTFGLPQKYVRRLIIGVAFPRMEYGLPVFYEPVHQLKTAPRLRGAIGAMRKFTTVQCMASHIITGAFRTTAMDILDYHAGLAPTQLHLNRAIHNALVHLTTLPKTHPLYLIVQCCHQYPHYHHSPVHEMLNAFPQSIPTETITPRTCGTHPQCSFFIAATHEAALAEANRLQVESLCVYSDGSGHQNTVGAAAVVPPQQQNVPAAAES